MEEIVSKALFGEQKQISITIKEATIEEAPEEAFQGLPTLVQDEDGWFLVPVDHRESRCPLDNLGQIEVHLRCGKTDIDFPEQWGDSWLQENSAYDIIKFRPI